MLGSGRPLHGPLAGATDGTAPLLLPPPWPPQPVHAEVEARRFRATHIDVNVVPLHRESKTMGRT